MTNTSQYRQFRRRSAAPLIIAMLAAWVLVLILAACGEVRQGPRVVNNLDRAPSPTSEWRPTR